MTIFSLSDRLGVYSTPEQDSVLTGTKNRPDTFTLFIKDKGTVNYRVYEPDINFCDKIFIVGIFSGIARIQAASSVLSKKSSEVEEGEKWKAIKELFRGISSLVPGSGIVFMIYDTVRMAIHIKKIKENIDAQDGVAGIAFDGEVLFTVNLALLDKHLTDTPVSAQSRLEILEGYSQKLLDAQEKQEFSELRPFIEAFGAQWERNSKITEKKS